MKKIKLYDVIFPIWFIWLLPPVILIAFAGNFIIDSIVMLISFKVLNSDKFENAIFLNPFSNVWGFLIVFACMAIVSVLIYVFNYNITFKKVIMEKALKVKMSLIFAIVTAPWTFLVPTKWFTKGF